MPTSSFNERVPKYRRHKASGQAVVTLDGRDHYLGKWKTAASRAAYRQMVAEWLANGCRLPDRDDHEITVFNVVIVFVRHAKRYYRKDGKITREATQIVDVLKLVTEFYGRTPATEFGPIAFKTVRDQMIRKGWSREHINKQGDRIKRMFKWAAQEELLPPSIYESLRCVSGLRKGRTEARETDPVEPVADPLVEITLAHLSEITADMVLFQRATGCRPAEVCILRPCDIDKSSDVWQYRPDSHKTEHHGKERIIFVGPKAAHILRPYLLRSAEAYCFSPIDSERKRREKRTANRKTPSSCGNTVGSNRKQNPKRTISERYNTNSYRKSIHRACDKAKIDRWSPNRLRHTAGTEIRKRFGLEAAQVALGHSQANVTEIYAERDHELAARVAREVG